MTNATPMPRPFVIHGPKKVDGTERKTGRDLPSGAKCCHVKGSMIPVRKPKCVRHRQVQHIQHRMVVYCMQSKEGSPWAMVYDVVLEVYPDRVDGGSVRSVYITMTSDL